MCRSIGHPSRRSLGWVPQPEQPCLDFKKETDTNPARSPASAGFLVYIDMCRWPHSSACAPADILYSKSRCPDRPDGEEDMIRSDENIVFTADVEPTAMRIYFRRAFYFLCCGTRRRDISGSSIDQRTWEYMQARGFNLEDGSEAPPGLITWHEGTCAIKKIQHPQVANLTLALDSFPLFVQVDSHPVVFSYCGSHGAAGILWLNALFYGAMLFVTDTVRMFGPKPGT